MKKRICLLFPVHFILLCCLYAQEDTAQLNRIKSLYFLTGTWRVEMDARLSLNGPWEKTQGKSVIQLKLNSNLLEEEYTGTREGKSFLSKTLYAVNNTDYKFQRIFIDGPHGVLIEFAGVWAGDSLIFDRLHTYGNGRTVKLRVVYQKTNDNEFTLESMRMPEGSTTWDTTGRMKYTRSR